MDDARTVFFISDSTGITAETVGHSLLSQFEKVHFRHVILPYVNTPDKAAQACQQIAQAAREEGHQPIVVSTLVDPDMRDRIASSKGLVLDIFATFLTPLEQLLRLPSSHRVGKSHTAVNNQRYHQRIEALHFTLECDDGGKIQRYSQADLVLVGVSRCGKTPACLYMALQFGIFAANYPITEEHLDTGAALPTELSAHSGKLYGLTITPERLSAIRHERRPEGRYASFSQCADEVRLTEALFRRQRIPFLDTTSCSVEEIATHILEETQLHRHLQ